MDKERRIQKWLDEPDCDRKEAEGIVAQEDGEKALLELETLLYTLDETRLIEMLGRGMRHLVTAVRAETTRAFVEINVPRNERT